VHRLDGVPVELVPVFLRPTQSNDADRDQEAHGWIAEQKTEQETSARQASLVMEADEQETEGRGGGGRHRGLVVAMAAVEDVAAAGRADPAPPPVVLAPARAHSEKMPSDESSSLAGVKPQGGGGARTRSPSWRTRGAPRRRAPWGGTAARRGDLGRGRAGRSGGGFRCRAAGPWWWRSILYSPHN
jgi:hypothetical protein